MDRIYVIHYQGVLVFLHGHIGNYKELKEPIIFEAISAFRLPGGNGFNTQKKIRFQSASKSSPPVCMTSDILKALSHVIMVVSGVYKKP